jgi:flagellar assembly protein FliH
MATLDASRVLKANSIRELGSKVVFNYDDVQRRCDEYVEQARAQARALLETAQAEADALRERALEEARQRGRSEGFLVADAEITKRAQALADEQVAERLSTALPAIRSLSESLVAQRERWLADWETTAIRLSVAIAEKIVRRELHSRPQVVETVLREALELASGTSRLRMRLNPHDLEMLGARAQQIVEGLATCGDAAFVADASISRGGCVLETEHGVIDARVETHLERIASELLDFDM